MQEFSGGVCREFLNGGAERTPNLSFNTNAAARNARRPAFCGEKERVLPFPASEGTALGRGMMKRNSVATSGLRADLSFRIGDDAVSAS
jgi:hypothetical protein